MRTMKIRTFNEGFQVRSHATRQALLVRKWQPLRLGIWHSASVNRSCPPHTTTLPAHVPQPPTASTCTFGASKREWRLSILLPLLYQVMRPRSGPERWQRRPILPSDWTCGAVMAARHAHLDLQYSSDDSLSRISRYFQRTAQAGVPSTARGETVGVGCILKAVVANRAACCPFWSGARAV